VPQRRKSKRARLQGRAGVIPNDDVDIGGLRRDIRYGHRCCEAVRIVVRDYERVGVTGLERYDGLLQAARLDSKKSCDTLLRVA